VDDTGESYQSTEGSPSPRLRCPSRLRQGFGAQGATAKASVPEALADAEAIQRELAPLVELRPLRKLPRTIAAVDADYHENLTFAAAILFHYDSCDRPFETRVAVRPTEFPLPSRLFLAT
jgi:hypothetical protein